MIEVVNGDQDSCSKYLMFSFLLFFAQYCSLNEEHTIIHSYPDLLLGLWVSAGVLSSDPDDLLELVGL